MSILQSTYATPRVDLGAAFMEFSAEEQNFIGEMVLAPISTGIQAGKFIKLTREYYASIEDVSHKDGADYPTTDFEAEDDQYSCTEKAMSHVLTTAKRAFYANDFDAELAAIKLLWLKIMLPQEKLIMEAVFNTSTWTGADLYTDNSGSPWDNIATNIIGQINDAKTLVRTNSGQRADSLVIGEGTLMNMLENTGIINRFPGAPIVTDLLLRSSFASIFGLKKLIVGGVIYNQANKGATFDGADMWADDYAMICKTAVSGDSIETPCIGRLFNYTGADTGEGVTMEEYPSSEKRGMVFRALQFTDAVIIDANYGHLLKIDA